jgi:hypothetical protein
VEVEAVVHVQVHMPQKLEVQVAEVQVHLYQMVRQEILLLKVPLKDLVVAVVRVHLDIILVEVEAVRPNLVKIPHNQILKLEVEEVQEQQLVFQLVP